MTFALVGCGQTNERIPEDVLSMNSFVPNKDNVKLLGRTHEIENTLWMAYSGSGAEFTFKGTRCSVTFAADDYINTNNPARVIIFVNGERAINLMVDESEKTVKVFKSETAENVTVRIVKASETGDSTCAIKSIEVEAFGSIKPTAKRAHSIEFIGDSITCAYGVDSPEGFSTFSEDCTKSYAYKTAELLDADCSLVCKSGHGIISGYTGDGTRQTWGVMGNYYENFGSGGGGYKGQTPDSIKWDFKSNKYDAVVINLGSNDNSYTGGKPDRIEEFKQGYIDFLKRVRELNPDSAIICTLGLMGDELYPTIEAAIEAYKSETGDTSVTSCHFDVQDPADGIGANWHPSDLTHTKAAEKLAAFMKDYLGW